MHDDEKEMRRRRDTKHDGARIMLTDPIIHVVTPRGRPDLARAAAEQREAQFEVWDMMTGALAPQLGGHPRYLDVIGVNYYHANQWEHPDHRRAVGPLGNCAWSDPFRSMARR